MPEDFFSRFKQLHASSAARDISVGAVFFCLTRDGSHVAIDIVDVNGRPTMPDYRLFSGNVMLTLRSLLAIKRQLSQTIRWGNKNAGNTVYLDEYAQLAITLAGCDNIVDEEMRHIGVSTTVASLALSVTEDTSAGTVSTMVRARVNDKSLDDYVTLGSNYIWHGDTIYPIASVGPNANMLPLFVTTVPVARLEDLLSIFFSFVENVSLDWSGHLLQRSDKEFATIPTIVFEKIDEDLSLYMRVTTTLPDQSPEAIERYDLGAVASVTDNGTVLLRPVTRVPVADHVRDIQERLFKAVGSRRREKGVFHDGKGFFIVNAKVASQFITGALTDLATSYRIIGAENLNKYKVKPVKPGLRLNLSSGIDFLDLDGEASVQLDDYEISIKDFLAEYGKNHYISLSDGTRAVVDEKWVKRLQRIFSRASDKGGKVKVSFFDLPEVEFLIGEKLEGAIFKAHRDFYRGFNDLPTNRIKVTGVNVKLRDYQRNGLKWINYLYENGLGGCLADDMGLGKTVQTISMLARVYPAAGCPSLIVMPRTLLFNWQQEFAKFAPQLRVATYYGQGRELTGALDNDVVMTTYAVMRNDIEQLKDIHFHYIILDESQNIKNVSAGVSQAAVLLNGDHRLALSGTPIENNLTELYSLFRFLNPGMFGTLEDFNSNYTYPIQRDGDDDAAESLRRRIYPFVLRRLKRDVLTELPARTDQTLVVEMSDEQRALYDRRRAYYLRQLKDSIATNGVAGSQMAMLQALSELRRVASVPESLSDGTVVSPKIEQIADTVFEATQSGHKVVVFFNFIAGIELLGERLTTEGIDYATMTGSTRDRQAVVERFQNDPLCRVMLMTLKTGGVGLNLTAADVVIIAEPWWNKAAEEQAINRLHRIGQHNSVLTYSVITADTIEEKILQLQQMKSQLFNSMIGADSASIKSFTEEDINFILS